MAAVSALRDAPRRTSKSPSGRQRREAAGYATPASIPRTSKSIIDGYRRFRGVGYLTTTAALMGTWADAEVAELAAAARLLRSIVAGGKAQAANLQPAMARIRALDRKLASLGDAVAATLGEASRQTGDLLMLINLTRWVSRWC
mgnify:CR=1 FL=1